jgi:tRNA threonylcarbamoyl adenosine modification protein YeaZ
MTCADSSSSLLLAVNGADERLQLALGESTDQCGVRLLAAQEWTVPGEAVRFLAPGVRDMLAGLGRPASDIGRIACVRGPGSFTGLRMSLAFAEGLAATTGARLAGLDHLALLAREAALTLSGGAVLALSWSRRGQVYAQALAAGGAPLCEALVLQIDDAPGFLQALPRPLFVLGGGLRRNLARFEELAAADSGLTLLPACFDAPRPAMLLELAAAAEYGAGPLSPAYLRASDAEDNLAAIAAGRGLSESEARAILARGSQPL